MMGADTTFLIPAFDDKWNEPVGREDLFVAAARNARACAEAGPILAGIVAGTGGAVEGKFGAVTPPVRPVILPEFPRPARPASQLRYLIAGLNAAETEWLAAVSPVQANFFDPEAFQYAREAAAKSRSSILRCGASSGWMLILCRKSMLSKLQALAEIVDRQGAPPLDLGAMLKSLCPDFENLVDAYRADANKRRGKAVNYSWMNSYLTGTSESALGRYRKIVSTMNIELSELRLDRVADFIDTAPPAERPISAWLEISAVNDAPPIYSPLLHWRKPESYPAYMTPDVFNRTVDLIARDGESCQEIHLAGIGESLQHPQYPEFLRTVNRNFETRSSPAAFHCYTDARLLSDDIAGEMMGGAIHSVMISLDAVDEGRYRSVRPTGDFPTVKRNVDRLLEIRRKKPRMPDTTGVAPVIALTTTLISELEDHIDTFMESFPYINKWMRRHGKNLTEEGVDHLLRQFYAAEQGVEHLVIQGPSTYAGRIPDRRLAIYTPLKRFACRRMLNTLFIKTDGSIVVCDRAFEPDGRNSAGNIKDVSSIQEVWERLGSRRQAHREGRYEEAYDLCKSCEDWFIPVD